MRVQVQNGNVDRAIRQLTKKLAAEHWRFELHRAEHATGKAERKRRKHKRAQLRTKRQASRAAKKAEQEARP